MSDPAWVQEVTTGLGSLLAAMDQARDSGDVVDWPVLMDKARGLAAQLSVATGDYKRIIAGANEKLANASKQIRELQAQLQDQQAGAPGVGVVPKGLGAGSGQTVYISAGATAGIAAGALLLGGVGGYAAKAYLETRKKKKAAKEAEEREEEPEEPEEPAPRRIARRTK